MKELTFYLVFIMIVCYLFAIPSCTHDPILGDWMDDLNDSTKMDTIEMDTMDQDTVNMDTVTTRSCDPDTIYFENHILPILVSNCALSGCHDATTANEGVRLDNYTNIISTGEIVPFNPSDSELFEVLIEDDPDKYMPPTGKLDDATIDLIATWIAQGALNNNCEETTNGDCDITNISLSDDIMPIFEMKCAGCHASGVASGNVVLDTYNGINTVAQSGQLIGALSHAAGFSPMPQGLDQLDECTINKIKSWIGDGAMDN
jgi:hypothetical protein